VAVVDGATTYLAGYVDSVASIESLVDLLDDKGGYSPFNEFSFVLMDEGLSSALRAEAINIYRSQVIVKIDIGTNIYNAYYGCVDNVSTTEEVLNVVCEDISLIAESDTLNPIILGDWNDSVTGRDLDLSGSEVEPTSLTYGLIFPNTTGNPNDNSIDDYEADEKAFTTVVKAVGETGSPLYTYYIDIYVETDSNISTNPNYSSIGDYFASFRHKGLEVVGADDSTSLLFHTLGADQQSDGVLRVYTVEDSATLEAGKTTIRFAYTKTKLTYSEFAMNSDLEIKGGAEKTPLIDDFKEYLVTGDITATLSKLFSLCSSDGKIQTSLSVPKSIYTFVDATASGWNAVNAGVTVTDDDQSFYARDLNSNNLICTIEDSAGASQSSTVKVLIEVDKKYLLEDDWSLGFSLTGDDPTHASNKGIGIADGHDLEITFKTLLNGDPTRVIDISNESLELVLNKHVRRFGETATTNYTSYIGLSPVLIDQSTAQISQSVNTYTYYYNTLRGLNSQIKAEHVIDKLYVELKFTVEAQSTGGSSAMNLYLESFFFFKDNLSKLEETVSVESGQGATWATDPKYTSGASDSYPRTRTEIARYILDVAGAYDPVNYKNDIFKGVGEDEFPIAFNNYNLLDKNCTFLINDVLQDSVFKLIGDNLGKRKMLNLYELCFLIKTQVT